MILATRPFVFLSPAKFIGEFSFKSRISSPNVSIFSSKFRPKDYYSNFKTCCTSKERLDKFFEGFSVLSSDTPWENGSTWSTMAAYFFSIHIPLSFGGLSVIAEILHQPVLDPQTEAVSLLLIETMELMGALVLLQYTTKLHYNLASIFQGKKCSEGRNWLLASALGFVFLALLVLLTSFLANRLLGPKEVNNPILKEILSSSPEAKLECFILYCFIAPVLEETVYRGFLLSSLVSTSMKWQHAVIVSSCVFSAAHFSGENSLQLFLIGCVLGCAYCWSGNLASSLAIHSGYNAAVLMMTILS